MIYHLAATLFASPAVKPQGSFFLGRDIFLKHLLLDLLQNVSVRLEGKNNRKKIAG